VPLYTNRSAQSKMSLLQMLPSVRAIPNQKGEGHELGLQSRSDASLEYCELTKVLEKQRAPSAEGTQNRTKQESNDVGHVPLPPYMACGSERCILLKSQPNRVLVKYRAQPDKRCCPRRGGTHRAWCDCLSSVVLAILLTTYGMIRPL
jgi:hypothetical protein